MPKPPTDIAALYARADKLLDQFPTGFDGAKGLLQQVLAAEPDHLDALHSLNWAWERDRDFHPATWQQELREPQVRLREHILALTRGVKPGGRETTGHKARALALAQHAEDLLRDAPSLATLKAVEAALAQSEALRDDLPERHRAQRGVMAWKAIHRARGGEPDAYQVLLDWVAENPRPSPFHDDEHACAFRGLESAFADEGFHAWLRAKKPQVAKGQRVKDLKQGMLHVGDWETSAELGAPASTPCRVGRLLALRALGADLSVAVRGVSLLERAQQLGDAALVKELEALSGTRSTAPAGKKSAAKADAGPDVASVAQVLADVHVTTQGTVVVLAATPHPDSDYGQVAGDDLWDFDNKVKWNQPWTDQVWLDQVTVDEDEVEHFAPTYDVDFNRLLTHDGKGWTRTKLPRALPYGYVASTLRDLGAPWGLTGFGVSVLAFDGGGKGWKLREVTGAAALDLVDGVMHESTLFGMCSANGLGRLIPEGKDLSFEQVGKQQPGLRGLLSHAGTLYAYGDGGLFALKDKALVARHATRSPVTGACAGPEATIHFHTDAQAFHLPASGKARKLALPRGAVRSLAFFKDHLFVSLDDRVLRLDDDQSTPLEVPTPAPGHPLLKVAGGRLWAVFPHHLAFTTDGKSFQALSFR